ncbi:hypothetical protein J4035_07670 [Cellulomonas sp. zg-ZUI188]|uniref:Uncharacterized protein n=1 Tax=Cellulomonas fengjieae TaxID=2819978 RepID=A0ABS3SGQ4_9CELL|nr:hypothetical protein [Cellulomonas fengjieae]QVI67152.1 hypothetical protein KG102_06105 [Cellulomonas fengjieae]
MAGDGTWDTMLARLNSAAGGVGLVDWSLPVDSTIARAHQHATSTTRVPCENSRHATSCGVREVAAWSVTMRPSGMAFGG